MISLRKPEGWDEYNETHHPIILTEGGILWVPNDIEVPYFPIPHRTFEEELLEAMSTPIEDEDD